MDYEIKLSIYNANIKVVIPTTWEIGIEQVKVFSEEFKKKNWTRHNSVGGVVQHMDQYHDLFNEGCVTLTKKKNG